MFAMSVFQSVLERLKAEAEDAAEDDKPETAANGGISGLPAGFVRQTSSGTFASTVASAYSSFAAEPPPPPVMPEHLCRTAPEDIAAELAIADIMTLADLNELRRTFARTNHPDSVHPDFRPNATIRMKIANMLIDEAARRLSP